MKNYKAQLMLAGSIFAAAATVYTISSPSSDPAAYFGDVVARQSAADSAVHLFEPKSLTAALPSTVYKYKDRSIRVSSLVATGTFSDPRELSATTNTEEPASTEAPPWKRGTVTFTISSLVASGGLTEVPKVGDRLQVEFYFDPAVDVLEAERGLTSLDSALAFFAGDGSATSPWTVAQNGSLVGRVDAGGRLSLLAEQKHDDGRKSIDDVLVNVTNVADLTAAVKVPSTVVVQ